MTRRVFRCVLFAVEQEPGTEPEYEVRCVSGAKGDEGECGARSGTYSGAAEVEEWQAKHAQRTGHWHYHRTFADRVVLRPPAEPAGLLGTDGEPA